jgi:hypothetical protein
LRIITALPPAHVVVGLFIVNNRPETIAHRFLQPPVSIAMLTCAAAVAGGDVIGWPRLLSDLARKYAWRGRGLRARNKPGAASRPGGWRSFGEYAFLEDSRYASQAESA